MKHKHHSPEIEADPVGLPLEDRREAYSHLLEFLETAKFRERVNRAYYNYNKPDDSVFNRIREAFVSACQNAPATKKEFYSLLHSKLRRECPMTDSLAGAIILCVFSERDKTVQSMFDWLLRS